MTMTINIRDRQDKDTPQISALYYNTVHTVNSEHYNPDQIAAWAPEIYGEIFWLERWEDCLVLVAETDGVIVGFAELRPTGEVDCLYVHHEYQRQGIGSQLMTRVVEEAKKQGIRRLFADVSITARPYFLAQGFEVAKEQILSYRGQEFQQYFMERML